jgi:hypothetical protein
MSCNFIFHHIRCTLLHSPGVKAGFKAGATVRVGGGSARSLGGSARSR